MMKICYECEKIFKLFNSYLFVNKVIIFASLANKNFKKGSDFDIAIVSDKKYSLREKRKLKDQLDDILGIYSFDLIFYNEADELLKGEINKGVVFYEKS